MLNIYDYLDYRAFLRDYYVLKKAETKSFSFRAFARRAELRSPNYLKLVMDGERNLTPEMAERFATACGLKSDQTHYFVDLVAFNQAKNSQDRDALYTKLTRARRYQKAYALEAAHADYHSTWYLPAIRELAARPDFHDDPAWIGKQLIPTVPRAKVSKALKTLEDLGLLIRDEHGRLSQGESLLSTGAEAQRVHIARYHRMMMERASESIDLVPPDDRDISSLTLCLGPDGVRRLKERIQRFRRELLELSALESNPHTVVQLNFQLFPLSKSENTKSKGKK